LCVSCDLFIFVETLKFNFERAKGQSQGQTAGWLTSLLLVKLFQLLLVVTFFNMSVECFRLRNDV